MGDWLRNFASDVVSHWVSELTVVAIGLGFAWLRKRQSNWLPIFSYGLGASVAVAIILYTFTGHAIFSNEQTQTTIENVEANIKAWCDTFGIGEQKQTDPKFEFLIGVHTRNGSTILVGRRKNDYYLQFITTMNVNGEYQAILNRLSKEQAERVALEVSLEMARSKIGYTITGQPLTNVGLMKAIPINSNLTEQQFLTTIDEVESDLFLSRDAIILAIQQTGIEPRPSLSP